MAAHNNLDDVSERCAGCFWSSSNVTCAHQDWHGPLAYQCGGRQYEVEPKRTLEQLLQDMRDSARRMIDGR